MNRPVAYKGARKTIEFALAADGRSLAHEFWQSLDAKTQAKLQTRFRYLGDHGDLRNKEQFKKIEGTHLFEFKEFQIRMPCEFRSGGLVVISHGFKKKADKIPPSEIERARRYSVTLLEAAREVGR